MYDRSLDPIHDGLTLFFVCIGGMSGRYSAFDMSLRQRNAAWGIRDLELVVAEAEQHGLTWVETIDMPANNLVVLFQKSAVKE